MRRVRQLFLLFLFFPSVAMAAFPIGMYGVPAVGKGDADAVAERLKAAGVDRVFVPADEDTIRFFKSRGLSVYVSVNVFGGRKAWETYPDSRPIKADGTPIGEDKGEDQLSGVCPTHEKWRQERLARIWALAAAPMDDAARPDGIWLDFIRYPGRWETPTPVVPDTCFCPRCLAKFAANTGVPLPEGLSAKEASAWIYSNAHLAWQKWKQAQIDDFAREAKALVAREADGSRLLLGVFTVPWTRSDFDAAVLFRLAQDAGELSAIADVVSPMVYHRMCGRYPDWAGYMTRYTKETARCRVWPIVQAVDAGAGDFSAAIRYAGRAGADGLLVFSMKAMTGDLWPGIGQFSGEENLIPNPNFRVCAQSELPERWEAAAAPAAFPEKTRYLVRPSNEFEVRKHFGGTDPAANCLGIAAGEDRVGATAAPIVPCEPGTDYLFTGRVYFDTWQRRVYPSVSLWGTPVELDTLIQARTFQPVRVHYRCTGEEADNRFSFANPHRGRTFWLKSPALSVNHPFRPAGIRPEAVPDFFPAGFFPIGVYGADAHRIEELRMLGVNTVFLGGPPAQLEEGVKKCNRIGMRYVIGVPRDPARLAVFLDRIRLFVSGGSAAFYVNDEPGIWAFDRNTAEDIYQLVKQAFPNSATAMAVVRPQVCRDFADAADVFMLDPYPVARRSLTRMADVLDRARADVGPFRVASVVQAFGGEEERWRAAGWLRPPTVKEMDCLAFLSVVHGARGIFFYTYGEIGKTDEGRQKLARVVGRLNRIYPWLKVPNRASPVGIEMRSNDRYDPRGRPAVHACIKATDNALLLIAVNAVEAPVAALIRPETLVKGLSGDAGAAAPALEFTEVFTGHESTMTGDGLYADFGPYETKAWELRR